MRRTDSTLGHGEEPALVLAVVELDVSHALTPEHHDPVYKYSMASVDPSGPSVVCTILGPRRTISICLSRGSEALKLMRLIYVCSYSQRSSSSQGTSFTKHLVLFSPSRT